MHKIEPLKGRSGKDQDLVILAQKGNSEAFADLVEQNRNLVYSLVLQMVETKEEAEEVAQDTFVKAYKSIKQFSHKSKFSTWIYKIAYFTAINHLRGKKQLNSSIDLIEIESEDDSALDLLTAEDRKKYITKAMSYLKPIDRNLLYLFYWKELSLKEIEEITLLTKANIKVKLLRIRKQMNGILTRLLSNEINDLS